MNSMKELTPKQQKIVDFIWKRQRTDGITPTQREIADEFGFTSPNSVTQHLRLIRKRPSEIRLWQGAFVVDHFTAGKIAQSGRGYSPLRLNPRWRSAIP